MVVQVGRLSGPITTVGRILMSSNLGVCVSMKVLDVRRARAFEAQYASIVFWKGPVAFADRLMSFSGRFVRTGLERR